MNQEQKQLPVPSLTPEQVQVLMNYANEQMPMKWGKEILAFIEKVAVELDRAQNQEVTEITEAVAEV
jgi:hypothetical protein